MSGVSARNIRAYRERGLLDPSRRVGRSALYDDYHLSQLNTIIELLARGFTSAHVADFFTSVRQGTDLADILGLQRAVLGPRTESGEGVPIDPDPDADEARKLVDYGLAEIVAGELVMVDGTAGEIMSRSPDPVLHRRALLEFIEAADDSLNDLAKAFVTSLWEVYRHRGGTNHSPRPEEMDELRRVVQDFRALGAKAMVARFDQAIRRFMMTSAPEYAAGILVSGEWEPQTAE